jgi:parallel beta helix pectate lyase-like protein
MKQLTILASLAIALQLRAAPKVQEVDCGKGETIAAALGKADPGDTINVTGVCSERVLITIDRISLAGRPGAIIQEVLVAQPSAFSGLVTVDGAKGARITGFTIQKSHAEGILGIRGAAFAVENTVVQDNGGDGIAAAEGSTLEMRNCTIRRSFVGVDVFTGSSAVLLGDIAISDNRDLGIFAGSSSSIEIRGAKVQSSNNPVGVVLVGGSSLAFFTYPGDTAKGGSLTLTGNFAAGMVVSNSAFDVYSDNATITASNNPVGIDMPAGGTISSPFGIEKGIHFVIENNGVGLNLGQGSNAVIIGGLTVRNNTTAGIVADNGSLTLVGAPPNPSSITGNALDLDFRFGARATFAGVTFATKKCEASVLARGIAACP